MTVSSKVELPRRLSYSALNTYRECPKRFRLTRLHGLDESTWFATLAGSALHEITEAMDRRDIFGEDVEVETFEVVFLRLLAKAVEKGTEIKASKAGEKQRTLKIGKTSGPNGRDRDWYLHWGPTWVEKWRAWRNDAYENGWRIATMPDGTPGIEVEVNFDTGGPVPEKGYIDRVWILPSGDLLIQDIKSGDKPDSDFQLHVYDFALFQQHDIRSEWGTFWLAHGDGNSAFVDLSSISDEYVANEFQMGRRGIEAGVFFAVTSWKCSGCGVQPYCAEGGGKKAVTIPVKDILVRPRV